jgi:hypothetical protein
MANLAPIEHSHVPALLVALEVLLIGRTERLAVARKHGLDPLFGGESGQFIFQIGGIGHGPRVSPVARAGRWFRVPPTTRFRAKSTAQSHKGK